MTSEDRHKTKSRRPKGPPDVSDEAKQAALDPEPPEQPTDGPKWREQAAFRVSFNQAGTADGGVWQTLAYREETDDREEWPYVAGDELVRWMQVKANLPMAAREADVGETIEIPAVPTPEKPLAVAQPGQARDLRLSVAVASLEEVLRERELGGAPSNTCLRARLDIQLGGTMAYLITASESRCTAHMLACDLETGRMAVLASHQQQLRADLLSYTAELEFDVPGVGMYQAVGAVLLPDNNIVGVAVGPALTVVP